MYTDTHGATYEYWSLLVRGEAAPHMPHERAMPQRQAAPYLHDVANEMAQSGWELVRSDPMRIVGLGTGADQYLLWFRRTLSTQASTAQAQPSS